MAKSVIIQQSYGSVKTVNTTDYDTSKIIFNSGAAVIKNDSHGLKKIKTSGYPISKIDNVEIRTAIESILEFRVKFTNIGIPGYGPNNPAPIGIAVIGYNNYIL